jgi:hypothetical protein
MDGAIAMRTRLTSQSLSASVMEFLGALRERGIEGKWPESQDAM